MPPTVSDTFAGVELRQAKSGLRPSGAALQEVSSVPGDLVKVAFDKASLDHDAAARTMGVSGSLLARQLQNLDNQHLSFQRLWNLDDKFWVELIVLIVDARTLSREPVSREIRMAL